MTWWSWLMVAWLGLGFGVVIAHHLWIDYTVQDSPPPSTHRKERATNHT